jgi:succinate dehydrogenase / fumarate reductase iron-sulfur subunit
MTASATNSSTVRIRITRRDKPDAAPYTQDFDVPRRVQSNVISCLQAIAGKPVTADGHATSPVVWDCNCLEEVCGACTMVVNGRVRQSCSTLIDELVKEGFGSAENPITLEPMSKFPVVRDLWVDRQRMFDNLIAIKGWVPIDGTHSLGAGPLESQQQQELRYGLSRCMTCGCCLEACPQFTIDNDFVGAQVFGQALYFNLHETGKTLKGERLDAMMEPGGITDCGNAQNCIKVCPKEVPLTEAIAAIGRQTTVHAIKRFFMGK